MSDNLRPVFLPYEERWPKGRKLMHALCSATAVEKYAGAQRLASAMLLRDLMREPARYEKWLERYTGGLILRLAYGKRLVVGKEPESERMLRFVKHVEGVVNPGAYFVDFAVMSIIATSSYR